MSTIFNFFGLRENPFKINPDPRFLFGTDQTRATCDELIYAITARKGLILLTGEVGTGKTMLIRRLLDWLADQKMPTALIFNSHIKPEHLLDLILNDFGVPCASTLKSEKLMALSRWLLDRYRAGQTPVLIVDEAQGLDPAALEEVRLFLNFETPREKLLQIVLAGQPELEIKLKRHELRQLRQRITVRCRTFPLTLEQTYGYIRERLRIAGANGAQIFEPDAVGAIHAYAHGIPRVINVLSEHSLINACADGARTVPPGAVEQAAHDCQLDRADSVARILNAGSYSTTGLSDIGALLASISASSDSVSGPIRQSPSAEALPASIPSAPFRHEQPSPPVRQVINSTIANYQLEANAAALEASATENNRVTEESHQVQQAPLALLPETPSEQTGIPETEAFQVRSAAQSNPSPLHFLRLWGQSFVSDARLASRQFRRAIRSFETRRLNPFLRHLRKRLRQLRTSASRLPSRPQLRDFRARVASVSQSSWIAVTSAMPPWLAKPFGIRQRETRERAQAASVSRVKRRRAVLSLRRWLHEPMTSQRKRVEGNARH